MQLPARLDAETDDVMPIAIVGISGRFPGDAENPIKLWDMIAEGRSALCDIPADRFNADAYYHPHNERQGTMNVKKAHFMQRDVSAFDAPFFTISVAEAQAMDPQQRMALECTYEALENGKCTLYAQILVLVDRIFIQGDLLIILKPVFALKTSTDRPHLAMSDALPGTTAT